MARIQALKQQRFLETSDSPVSSFQVEGGGGVPQMHPLKSSNPVFKASNLFHIAKLKAPRLPKPKGIRLPKL